MGYTGSPIYEIMTEFIFSSIAIVVASLLDKRPRKEPLEEHDRVEAEIKNMYAMKIKMRSDQLKNRGLCASLLPKTINRRLYSLRCLCVTDHEKISVTSITR